MVPLHGPCASEKQTNDFNKHHKNTETKNVFCIHAQGTPLEYSDVLTKTYPECSPSSDPNEPTNYGYLRIDTPCEIFFEGKKYSSIQDVWDYYYSNGLIITIDDMMKFMIKIINYRWLNDSGFRNVFNLKSPRCISCLLLLPLPSHWICVV